MTALPPAATEDAFTTVCQDEAALRPGVERLARRLGLDVAGLTRFAVGSRPVYASGDLVLKLFPPVDQAGCQVEAAVLTAVQGQLPTPVPRVHATGEHDGWGYVLMSRLPGVAAQLAAFLDRVELPARPPVLLHTEREYEFVGLGVFVAEGDARFLARTLVAYGYDRDQLGSALRRRLLAWGILHRYSHLASWLRRLPGPPEPTLDALADHWFATG